MDKHYWLKKVGEWMLCLFTVIFLWQCIIWITRVPEYILPSPYRVAQAFINHFQLIAQHTWITANEVLLGLLLGSLLGMATALGLLASRRAQKLILPLLIFSQTIPIFALAPLLTLWLGYGLASKVVMAILIVYFPVASTFYDGLNTTPVGYLNLAQTMGANTVSVIFRVRLPAALPSLASGIRLAAVYAPIGAVIGEWVGASQGLGYLMLLANGRVKTALMFAALLALCIFAIILRMVVNILCDKMVAWSQLDRC